MNAAQQTFDPRRLDRAPGKVELRRALLDVRTAATVLDVSEETVLEELQQGRLRWAWDLSAAQNGRAFLRIWNRSLICYLKPELEQPKELDGVLLQVVPPRARLLGALSGVELQALFNTTGGHVLSLFDSGALTKVANSPQRRGRGGSPRATLTSVTRLLKERLFC
jgi:hypothetical protein